MFDSDHSFSIDQCGNVDQISEHAAVLIPFYFLPLMTSFVLIAKEIISRVKTVLSNRLVVAIVIYFDLVVHVPLFSIIVLHSKQRCSQDVCDSLSNIIPVDIIVCTIVDHWLVLVHQQLSCSIWLPREK